MAERPGELEEETQIRDTASNTAVKTTADTSDNVYLEKRSADDLTSGDAESTPSDEITDDTEQIREQIEETRSNLGETISAIQEKLSFSNISEQVKDEVSDHISSAINTAKDSVYEATLGKVGTFMTYIDKGMNEMSKTSVGRSASQNPVALSLIGLGLGMLLINGFSTKKRSTYSYESDYDDDYDTADNYRGRNFSSRGGRSTFETAQNKVGGVANSAYKGVSSAAGSAYEGVSSVAGSAYEGVGNAAGAVSETVGSVAGTVSDTVSSAASGAYRQVGNLGSKAKDVAGSAQDQYEHYMDENPLAVGAVALVLGAAVGMAFPSTQAENRLMGETRENLLQKAEETAREAIGKVQQVAGEVSNTVKEVAGDVANTVKEGAGNVATTVKDGAGEVAQTAKDEAKKQGLSQR
ncbi:MAG TPA: DUF3618 domain-containing protein [Pyrinomonadaceae bacterium]|nr:DUF3618 domain-containing protein [Pyrinomonadaceae bacterium]